MQYVWQCGSEYCSQFPLRWQRQSFCLRLGVQFSNEEEIYQGSFSCLEEEGVWPGIKWLRMSTPFKRNHRGNGVPTLQPHSLKISRAVMLTCMMLKRHPYSSYQGHGWFEILIVDCYQGRLQQQYSGHPLHNSAWQWQVKSSSPTEPPPHSSLSHTTPCTYIDELEVHHQLFTVLI